MAGRRVRIWCAFGVALVAAIMALLAAPPPASTICVSCSVYQALLTAERSVKMFLGRSSRSNVASLIGKPLETGGEHSLGEVAHAAAYLILTSIVGFFENWGRYIAANFEENPGHVIVETCCILCIIYLVVHRRYDPDLSRRLAKSDEEELILDWVPEPLVPTMSLDAIERIESTPVVESATEKGIVRVDGRDCLNFASFNFLGIANDDSIKAACQRAIDKYGVGSCGPRGFYGTVDTHLEVENAIANFMGTEAAILYSDGIATMSSVIPCFSKRFDILVVDENVHYGVRSGVQLSRSKVFYYRHNDMEDLERILSHVASLDASTAARKEHRRFIVTEGIFQNSGDLAPLEKIVEMKSNYHFRLILDDTMAIGVIGDRGRGSVDHWNLKIDDVEILCASMDTCLATVGGFCCGSDRVIDHQRLSGSGYVFSASSPMYTCVAGVEALRIIDHHPEKCKRVREGAQYVRAALQEIDGIKVLGSDISPIIHIALSLSDENPENPTCENLLYDVRSILSKQHNMLVGVASYIAAEKRVTPQPTLRIVVSADHTIGMLDDLAKCLRSTLSSCLAAA